MLKKCKTLSPITLAQVTMNYYNYTFFTFFTTVGLCYSKCSPRKINTYCIPIQCWFLFCLVIIIIIIINFIKVSCLIAQTQCLTDWLKSLLIYTTRRFSLKIRPLLSATFSGLFLKQV